MNRAVAYSTLVKTAKRAAEPAEGSGWGELHEDTACGTEARNPPAPEAIAAWTPSLGASLFGPASMAVAVGALTPIPFNIL